MPDGQCQLTGTRKYVSCMSNVSLVDAKLFHRHTFSTFDHQKVIDLLNLWNMYLPLHYLRRLVYYTPDQDVSNYTSICGCYFLT